MQNFLSILLICFITNAFSQKKQEPFSHVEPPFWWTGMKNDSLQILLYSNKTDLKNYKVEITYEGVEFLKIKTVENPHYLFLDLRIGKNARPGVIPIQFTAGKRKFTYSYELRQRDQGIKAQGFGPADVIYLIMPDRFANSDPANDSIPGMYEGVNRANPEARHGGDLKGINNHLDYIYDLGVTALWLNPVLENNQKRASYHGYAITDLYKVDRRFGTNEDYLKLITDCHDKGLKVIQDFVMNHLGDEHWLVKDPPEGNWIHTFPQFTRSNYRSTVVSDPYRSKEDLKLMSNGWFDTTMPDVDQSNKLFATYLIQNTLWWIEYGKIDGIRMDTYVYPDKTFMANWCQQVLNEYPGFNIVGEVWINDVAATAYWQRGMVNKDGYESNLPSVTDFPLFFTLPQALTEEGGWDAGLTRLYNLLCRDFIYPDPFRNVIFLDNHDLSRFFLLCGKDINRFKMGLAFLLTTRGIPQLYYGTELLMDGDGAHHPNVRLDFPGGWAEDKQNAFNPEGRSAEQNDVYDYLRKLLNWRKTNSAIHTGKLTHFVPENNVYVYFRSNEHKTVMVVINGNKSGIELNTKRFAESIGPYTKAVDILTEKTVDNIGIIAVPPSAALILELR